jgi:hypothetical protein
MSRGTLGAVRTAGETVRNAATAAYSVAVWLLTHIDTLVRYSAALTAGGLLAALGIHIDAALGRPAVVALGAVVVLVFGLGIEAGRRV